MYQTGNERPFYSLIFSHNESTSLPKRIDCGLRNINPSRYQRDYYVNNNNKDQEDYSVEKNNNDLKVRIDY